MVAGPLAVDGREPGRRERPGTPEDLARILGEAVAGGEAVIPVGGGRALGMGGVPTAFDLALETGALDRVLEHAPHDLTVTVEAGVPLAVLQEQLAVAGQFLPLDPFAEPGHTVGGLLATGWSGPLRLKYGTPREFLIGLRVALPDGKLVRSGGKVVKNVSGYDLNKLHLGALGSLGVIVEASFKVYPRPLAETSLRLEVGTLDEALGECARALAHPLRPAALELERAGGRHVVAARISGTAQGVERAVRDLGWPQVPDSWWKEYTERSPERWVRVSARSGALGELIAALPAGADFAAHAGSGVVHWFGATAAHLPAVRSAAEARGGSAVILAGPPDLKAAGAWGSPPPTVAVMRTVKSMFDPAGRMSPGRYVL